MNAKSKASHIGKARRSSFLKMLMVILCLISGIAAVGGSVLAIVCIDQEIYTTPLDRVQEDAVSGRCIFQIEDVYQSYNDLKKTGYFDEETTDTTRETLRQQYLLHFHPEYTNFFFKVENEQGEVLLQSADLPHQYQHRTFYPQWDVHTETRRMSVEEYNNADFSDYDEVSIIGEIYEEPPTLPETTEPVTSDSMAPTIFTGDESMVYDGGMTETDPALSYHEEEVIQAETEPSTSESPLYYEVRLTRSTELPGIYITGYVKEVLDVKDDYHTAFTLSTLVWQYRYAPFFLIGIGVIMFAFSLWFLLTGAGYRSDNEEATLSAFDRIPFDLFTGLLGLAGLLILVLLDDMTNFSSLDAWAIILAGCTALAMMLLFWLMSTTVRVRTNTIWKNNILTYLAKALLRSFRRTSDIVQALPVIWQAPAALAGFFFLQFIGVVLILAEEFVGLAFLIMLWALGLIAGIVIIINMHILEKGADKLANGDLQTKINERDLFGPFRRHAVKLNSISDGMNKAVTERLKSETFKSELIANVSHDIRTPLTSIINYTDLLAKRPLDDPQAEEYINVLQRQSARLRKLTEDVLEASKASTGAITVERTTLDLRVLIEQMLGEYAGRLEAKHLEMVTDMPDTPLPILADGRLMWRVMDNLLANICKYAMEGTRVYLNASSANREISVILRNISGSPLNISAEALMERFVRGDRSRNTEGSGLGLSIAQSLTELQGGKLQIAIDGDLFKVTLQFPETDMPASE